MRLAASFLAIALALPHAAAAAPETPVRRARWLMGTLCTAEVTAADTLAAAAATTAALDEIARLEQVMSSWRDDSELMRVSRRASTAPAPCSADLAAVLDSAL
ncbi:MAG TPA: FAD:protein FMN transferase, partial [Candidatus Eisenbacteria bacterium]|nr:FAD:protein FMN transferase [Candidatus Eisenbacteria bacterium]